MDKNEFVRRLTHTAPEIGDTFKLANPTDCFAEEHSWRCNGYIKLVAPERMMTRGNSLGALLNNKFIESAAKKNGKLMVWCEKDEATHVTGVGVAGITAKICDIEVTGRVSWDEETIQKEVEQHRRLIGRYVD
jgi:hypothetical protein